MNWKRAGEAIISSVLLWVLTAVIFVIVALIGTGVVLLLSKFPDLVIWTIIFGIGIGYLANALYLKGNPFFDDDDVPPTGAVPA